MPGHLIRRTLSFQNVTLLESSRLLSNECFQCSTWKQMWHSPIWPWYHRQKNLPSLQSSSSSTDELLKKVEKARAGKEEKGVRREEKAGGATARVRTNPMRRLFANRQAVHAQSRYMDDSESEESDTACIEREPPNYCGYGLSAVRRVNSGGMNGK